jgi:hypothetical protein
MLTGHNSLCKAGECITLCEHTDGTPGKFAGIHTLNTKEIFFFKNSSRNST